MKLYDFLKVTEGTYYTCDTEYDAAITVDYIDEENDNYDKFCNELYKRIEMTKQVNEYTLVIKLSEFIDNNFELFDDFAKRRWTKNYSKDKEDLIYAWIEEFNLLTAGYGTESIYKEFIELFEKCE